MLKYNCGAKYFQVRWHSARGGLHDEERTERKASAEPRSRDKGGTGGRPGRSRREATFKYLLHQSTPRYTAGPSIHVMLLSSIFLT